MERDLCLPAIGSWPASVHHLDQASGKALIAALAAQRPLLVRGEPGVGKSQLARAAAAILGWHFACRVIQPHTEAQELLWSYDYTQRLADAQMASVSKDATGLQDHARYVAPGPVWYALNWAEAAGLSNQSNYRPPEQAASSAAGTVLLLDEIDKAEISLANTLLEVLGNNGFEVPPLGRTVQSAQVPLVILTSNATRELPAALVRRCVVLELRLPEQESDLTDYLVRIGRAHQPEMSDDILHEAARQIVQDRAHCAELPKTGLAEYLDLLRALCAISPDVQQQQHWLAELSGYFQKSRTATSVVGGMNNVT
jgi:MoxR-like ATPase